MNGNIYILLLIFLQEWISEVDFDQSNSTIVDFIIEDLVRWRHYNVIIKKTLILCSYRDSCLITNMIACKDKGEMYKSLIKWVSEWLLLNANSMRWWWWCLLCSRPTRWVGFYSASSLKQQFAGGHVAPIGHIILIPTQPVFVLSP